MFTPNWFLPFHARLALDDPGPRLGRLLLRRTYLDVARRPRHCSHLARTADEPRHLPFSRRDAAIASSSTSSQLDGGQRAQLRIHSQAEGWRDAEVEQDRIEVGQERTF